jgi:hypothetical protein
MPMTEPRILEPHCEWTASDFADEDSFTEHLTTEELAELDGALRHALTHSDDPLELGKEHFPLPNLATRLGRIEEELINGRGFVRIRGIDRSAYSQSDMELLYWGIGTHLGLPWAQNKHGHVLGDVTDQARAGDPNVRGNEIGGAPLPFHCDGSDLVGLLCLANGIEGGLSAVSNSVNIHNRLVRERPDLAEVLYGWFPYDFRGEQAEGAKPYYLLPVFTEWEDRLFVRCIPPYVWASQRHPDTPRLTAPQIEALRAVEAMAQEPDNHVTMELRPGDIQFINNYHVLHGRTAYVDDRSAGQIRHLKRLWLETTVLPSRPAHFSNSRSHWETKRSTSRMAVVPD